MSGDGFVEDLVVGHGCLQLYVPVDQTFAAIDQSFLEELHKSNSHGFSADLVEGKAFPLPVATATHNL